MTKTTSNLNTPKSRTNFTQNENPIPAEQLDILITLLEDFYQQGTSILIPGFSTGILEEQILRRIPGCHLIGIQSSSELIQKALLHLHSFEGQFQILECSPSEVHQLKFPPESFSLAVMCQALTLMDDTFKQLILDFVAETLPPWGKFFLMETLRITSPHLFPFHKSILKRISKIKGLPFHADRTYDEYLNSLDENGEIPATLDRYLAMLQVSGFEAVPLHLYDVYALIAARKIN